MSSSTFHRAVLGVLLGGAAVFILLLAGVGSSLLTRPALHVP